VTMTEQTATPAKGEQTAYGFGGSQGPTTILDRDVVVGSCLTGQLVGDQGEKAKVGTSVGRKVPSS